MNDDWSSTFQKTHWKQTFCLWALFISRLQQRRHHSSQGTATPSRAKPNNLVMRKQTWEIFVNYCRGIFRSMKNDIHDEPATVLPLSAGPGNIDTCFASRIFRLGRGGASAQYQGRGFGGFSPGADTELQHCGARGPWKIHTCGSDSRDFRRNR